VLIPAPPPSLPSSLPPSLQVRDVLAHAARYRSKALFLFGASSSLLPSRPSALDVCSLPPSSSPSLSAAAVLAAQQEAYTAHRQAPFPLSLLPEAPPLAWLHAVCAWLYRAMETLEGAGVEEKGW